MFSPQDLEYIQESRSEFLSDLAMVRELYDDPHFFWGYYTFCKNTLIDLLWRLHILHRNQRVERNVVGRK